MPVGRRTLHSIPCNFSLSTTFVFMCFFYGFKTKHCLHFKLQSLCLWFCLKKYYEHYAKNVVLYWKFKENTLCLDGCISKCWICLLILLHICPFPLVVFDMTFEIDVGKGINSEVRLWHSFITWCKCFTLFFEHLCFL